jgi:hypothetical protein
MESARNLGARAASTIAGSRIEATEASSQWLKNRQKAAKIAKASGTNDT